MYYSLMTLRLTSTCLCSFFVKTEEANSVAAQRGREPSTMAFAEEFSNVQVLYQLSWEGKLDHPHMITVQYPSNQDGLRLRGKSSS